ncbi:MAG: hypothetical protein IAF02_24975, partial [Anaerolineae bacterium]|nr:hypothetical protein [Anaerolineae bacterium]
MLTQTKSPQINTTIILLISGVCASIFMVWVTAYAIGTSPDSLIYLDTAENILVGNGVYTRGEPMTHYPPGYPLILTLVGLLQRDNIIQSARFLHIILFGCNVFLVGFTTKLCTNDNLLAIGIAILGFLTSFAVISSHAMVWSDPPFITLLLTAFILLTWHVINPKWVLIWGLTGLTSFAIILRFIGVTFIPAVILTILLFDSRTLHKKLKDIVIFVMISSLPLIIWLGRNIAVAQTVADRESSFQFLGFHLDLHILFSRFYEFVLPLPMPTWFKALQFVIVIFAITLGILVLYKKKYIQHNRQLSQVVLPATY